MWNERNACPTIDSKTPHKTTLKTKKLTFPRFQLLHQIAIEYNSETFILTTRHIVRLKSCHHNIQYYAGAPQIDGESVEYCFVLLSAGSHGSYETSDGTVIDVRRPMIRISGTVVR